MVSSRHPKLNASTDTAGNRSWRLLHQCDGAHEVQMLLTCLEAMGFEARLMVDGTAVTDWVDLSPDFTSLTVEVREENWSDLHDILDELLDEQTSFDDRVQKRKIHNRRLGKWLFLGFILIVIGLAVFRIIKL